MKWRDHASTCSLVSQEVCSRIAALLILSTRPAACITMPYIDVLTGTSLWDGCARVLSGLEVAKSGGFVDTNVGD